VPLKHFRRQRDELGDWYARFFGGMSTRPTMTESPDPPELFTAEIAEPPIAGPPLVAPLAPLSVPQVDADVISAELVNPWSNLPPARSWPVRLWRGVCFTLAWMFGLMSLIGCLAAVSVVPILNFASLGYLLEASGRVTRSGRLRDGFIDLHRFARIGSLVAGTWLMLLPIRVLAGLTRDAEAIPGNPAVGAWRLGLTVCTILMVGHILLAWYSGGKLRHFFWPLLAPFQLGQRFLNSSLAAPLMRYVLKPWWPALFEDLFVPLPWTSWFPPAILWDGLRRGKLYVEARDAVWDFVVGLRLPHYVWLGFRGFLGALLWLCVPITLLSIGTSRPTGGAVLIGYIGALLLALVLLYLPFLQAHLAAENRFAAIFEWSEIRKQFKRAPLMFWIALVATLAFALPLYLLKIEKLPQPLMWTLSIFFVVSIYPARLLTGWTLGYARRRDRSSWFIFRWLSRLAAIPVVLFFVLVVFLTQYTSWNGVVSLFEQHAFLVPVPFLGM
jgi:hypothetical protein